MHLFFNLCCNLNSLTVNKREDLHDLRILMSFIGKNIQSIRQANNMSQKELGAKIGAEKSAISRLESGYMNPTIKTLFKISKVFEIPVCELLNTSP